MPVNSLSSSGQYINVDALVQNAVHLQQQRLYDFQSEKSSTDTQISTLGQVKSQLSSLEDKFVGISTAINNFNVTGVPTGLTVNATGNGAYSVAVNSLASSQIIAAKNPSVAGALGYSGTLNINIGSYDVNNVFSVNKSGTPINIVATDNLQNIVTKINASNNGVSASIINGNDGQHLSLSNSVTGAANGFQINTTDTGTTGISALSYSQGVNGLYNNVQSAKDGFATVNGVTIASANNTFVASPTLSFSASTVIANQSVTVKRDDTVVAKAIADFVKDYNTTTVSLKNKNVDSQFKNFTSQLRTVLANGTYSNNISNIGLSFDKNGVLNFDNTKFTNYAASNSAGLSNLISNQFSVGSASYKFFDTDLSFNGVIDNKVNNLTQKSKTLDNTISSTQAVLSAQIKSYQFQFASLDKYLGQLNDNSNNISQLIKQFSK